MELTIEEVADRLNLPGETIQRWIRQGKIPMQLSRGRYTIRSEMLERWAYEHQLNISAARQPAVPACAGTEFDSVLAAMQRGGVFYDMPGTTREEVIEAAVQRLPNIQDDARDLVLGRLIEREALASTGIGHGIALPHPRSSLPIALAQPQITTCFLREGVSYDAIDQRPVSILMVLLSCSTRQHLSMIAKLSFLLRDVDFRDYLLGIPGQKALLTRLAALEAGNT